MKRQSIKGQYSNHIETSPLICTVDELTGFYVVKHFC